MPTTAAGSNADDHRLRYLVQRTGDVTAATGSAFPARRAWLTGRDADGRGRSACGGPHRAGAPTGGPEAAATPPQAHGTAPAGARPVPNLGVSAYRCASAGRARR